MRGSFEFLVLSKYQPRSYLAALAAAWHGGFTGASSKYVKNAKLRSQIGAAMDWWFDRDFTVSGCLDKGGTKKCPCGTPGEFVVLRAFIA